MPGVCVLCDRTTFNGRDLCDECHDVLPFNGTACVRCALPLGMHRLEGGVCGACFAKPPPFERTVTALVYRDPVPMLVRRVKFHSALVEAHILGSLLATAVEAEYAQAALPLAIVPVPLSWRRLAGRGHNQATLIARPVARRLDLPIAHELCRRIRHTPPQTGLSRTARQRNLAGAFEVRGRPPERIALVDDVMTTGATLRALTRTLRRAGAHEVHLWVVARTPGTKSGP